MAAAGACADAGPVVGIIMFQVIFAGLNVFYKLALADGMDLRVLIAYRYFFASISLAPVAYFIERRDRTKVTWKVLGLSFLSSLCGGSMAQNLYIAGMKLTSATFASATTNLLPAITFILALIFRFEKLAITTFPGQAKVAGTLLGVGGAMLLTFYKGVDITPWHSRVNLIATITQPNPHHPGAGAAAEGANYAMGSLLCVTSCCFYALWLIVQAKLSNIFPFYYSNTALMCIITTLQSTAFALCFDRDAAQWRLGLNVRLLCVAYAGVFGSAVALVLLALCVQRRGPLFASVFSPLMLLMVAVLSSLLLGEKLHLGTALGAVLIVVGLYAVLWGKGREVAAAGNGEQQNTGKEEEEEGRHNGGAARDYRVSNAV
ncbi:hypothetical protein U9M48_043823 [Paspalum notatum var. saurae]|uniref:WAT1-related protein n=1 Tax=Paspalum notatum var. saurae TaxID=547442 RepID=A0AAQ3XIY0_PASNO